MCDFYDLYTSLSVTFVMYFNARNKGILFYIFISVFIKRKAMRLLRTNYSECLLKFKQHLRTRSYPKSVIERFSVLQTVRLDFQPFLGSGQGTRANKTAGPIEPTRRAALTQKKKDTRGYFPLSAILNTDGALEPDKEPTTF